MTRLEACRRAVGHAIRAAHAPLTAQVFRTAAQHVSTPEAALDLAFSFRHLGVLIAPYQIRSEMRALLEFLAERPPRTVLEIGTARGGSLFLLASVATPDAHLVSIDLPHGEFGGGYPPWRAALFRAFTRDRQRLDLLRADSHAPVTVDAVRACLENRPLDFLFIDGDHRYDGVRRDFESYAPLVRPGGWIGLHDIVPGPAIGVGDVPAFWQDVRAGREYREFVESWQQGGYGIGLVQQK